MSRPTFALTDEQSRTLLRLVAPLFDRFPLNPASHRPFTRAFLSAVHQTTGKTFGPDIYRRLLRAYAPGRNPSTATLVLERDHLDRELALMPAPASDAGPSAAPGQPSQQAASPHLVATALRDVLADYLPMFTRQIGPGQVDAQIDYLTSRLSQAEQALLDARSQAACLASQRQEQAALARTFEQQLILAQAALAGQQQAVVRLTDELKGQRLFAMQAIEDARSETRTAKERAAYYESALRESEKMNDVLRMRNIGAATGGAAGSVR